MIYAVLAYHAEGIVESWTPEEDAALMDDLLRIHDGLVKQGKLGPAARLGPTVEAATVRGAGLGQVIDGPFAETKEALLGFYLFEAASQDEVLAHVRELKRVNPTAVYEIRPVMLYLPGAALDSGRP